MSIKEILEWQWDGYAKYHRSRANLLLHIIAVPFFIVGVILLVLSIFNLSFPLIAISVSLMVGSIVVQGIGHSKESLPPEPFTGPTNAILRIILEQLYTFPKFVICGNWLKAYKSTLYSE
ncbi:hypothetical protein N480_04130 [Pseudoalteromonas luteoviolacea S2607]|uniref:Mpo1-like protein n=1 Tax=Pseudoalteromonas luteoviolacea TaxID=43657 RepID=UPI0007B09428|nr:Mpo1-like protein [Pseudoalteromonas luteoviolacea]KZN30143.1 hypothetical protein N480_04130 [Pseudoalteromonas luteoviolacea S2607]